ncbi:HvfC/BufC N-terminal domain-containing protein [Lichenifustis flavocetrariae]|uniref:DNA-binding domain-containing protein n=1 Tax=Lichenifustis flavocetrariae TaxID=2949735 RepID=A0AA41Z936_9HYPH|nr:DNA-binding domain-containing protein [Lichenifustis flavocetrariae]MCW6512580.1 DNA-binding domain-containing protein [Lichenifustis flavocetrariae]
MLEIQDAFTRALLERDRPIPPGLTCSNGLRPERRFAIHRDNVVAGLIATLASRFPATQRIVGAPFFVVLARAFIDRHPPRSPVLLEYGKDLPSFVEAFEPARDLPYLADVIRLEAARGRAYHAADMPPLDPQTLAVLPQERLPFIRFDFHPATSMIRSSHPIVTIWAMNADGSKPKPVEPWLAEDAMVSRPTLNVRVHRLPSGGGTFLSLLAAGSPLGDAVEAALSESPNFNLSTNLAFMLGAGVTTAIR